VQVVVAILVAGLLLFVVRPLVKRKFTQGELDNTIGAASLVGREARVLQTVTDTDGRIKLAGETWSARVAEGAEALLPGDDARVIAIHGATAIVAADRH
jgi:membrane protein implicated in regulation of membrane protease activity